MPAKLKCILAAALLSGLPFAAKAFADAPAAQITEASKAGIGAVLDYDADQRVVVRQTLPDSPAQHAGLKEGDVIVLVNRLPMAGAEAENVAARTRGAFGSDVQLVIRRGSETLHFTMTRANVPTKVATPTAHKPAPAATAELSRTIRFSHASIDDPLLQGKAYDVLVPAGWKMDGRVIWDFSCFAMPANMEMHASSPDGSVQFNRFPTMMFQWSPSLEFYVGLGRKATGVEIRRPIDNPVSVVTELLMPQYRRGARNVRVILSEDLPRAAEAAAALCPEHCSIRVCRVLVEYNESASKQPLQEEFNFFLARGEPGVGDNTTWALDYVTSFRSCGVPLDAHMPELRTIAASPRQNPAWLEAVTEASKALVRMEYTNQAAIMERFHINTATGHAISETTMRSWRDRNAATNRVLENFDRKAIRGVEPRVNPFTNEGEETSTMYSHVWETANGDRICSNDPNFNPNAGSNLNWKEAHKAN
jgi:hypothetical protein